MTSPTISPAMPPAISLQFESKLGAPREWIWEWITSLRGVSAELSPLLRMTAPKGVRGITDVEFKPGVRLFRSRIYLFGILPIDRSDLTLLELDPGRGFLEQSPMLSMRLWRHERRILDCPDDSTASLLIDRLSFPRAGRRAWCAGSCGGCSFTATPSCVPPSPALLPAPSQPLASR